MKKPPRRNAIWLESSNRISRAPCASRAGSRISTGTRCSLLASRLRRPCGRDLPFFSDGSGSGAASFAPSTDASRSAFSFASTASKSPSASWSSLVWSRSVFEPNSRRLSSAFSCARSVRLSSSAATLAACAASFAAISAWSAAILAAIALGDIASGCSALDDTTPLVHVAI